MTEIIIKNLSTISVISSKLTESLDKLFNKTTSIGISVYNMELGSIYKADEEYTKYIESFKQMINTLNLMMKNIESKSEDKDIVLDINNVLIEICRDVKGLEYKVFYLRKAIETKAITDIIVIIDSYTKDLTILKNHIRTLNDISSKIINKLKFKTP